MIVVCLYVVAHQDIGYDVTEKQWICQRCARKAGLVKGDMHAWFVADREHDDGKDYFYCYVSELCCVCHRKQRECALIQTWTLEVKSNA